MLLLPWAVISETPACDAGRCSEELCFLLLFSSPNNCCVVSRKHIEMALRAASSLSQLNDQELNPVHTNETRILSCPTCSGRGNPPVPESFSPPDARRDGELSLWSPETGRRRDRLGNGASEREHFSVRRHKRLCFASNVLNESQLCQRADGDKEKIFVLVCCKAKIWIYVKAKTRRKQSAYVIQWARLNRSQETRALTLKLK